MSKIKVHPNDCTMYMYWDIATNSPNAFYICENGGWKWNGDYNCPTVTPSILNTCSVYITPNGDIFSPFRNHCFIENGTIKYLSDCTHYLAGKTVDMVDFPEDW